MPGPAPLLPGHYYVDRLHEMTFKHNESDAAVRSAAVVGLGGAIKSQQCGALGTQFYVERLHEITFQRSESDASVRSVAVGALGDAIKAQQCGVLGVCFYLERLDEITFPQNESSAAVRGAAVMALQELHQQLSQQNKNATKEQQPKREMQQASATSVSSSSPSFRGIYILLFCNFISFLLDHVFEVSSVKALYLNLATTRWW